MSKASVSPKGQTFEILQSKYSRKRMINQPNLTLPSSAKEET